MNSLKEEWKIAAKDLKIEIKASFTLFLPSGKKIEAELLVKNFGAKNGMIIITDYDKIKPFVDEITKLNYGYSTLEQPLPTEKYNRDYFIELLNDWGWSGDNNKKPSWI